VTFDAAIFLALCADYLLGDPRRLPHPVRFIAWLALRAEGVSRGLFTNRRLAGLVTVITVLALIAAAVAAFLLLSGAVHPGLFFFASLLLLYTSLALRDMIIHSRNVHRALTDREKSDKERLALARQRVGMIVGRDTAALDEAGVVRACVESVAENLVDGICAPLFWAFVGATVGELGGHHLGLLGGVLAAMLYKAINTMDSLFGYRNDRYREFGFVPARLDDLANYLPARLTAILMIFAAAFLGHDPAGAWRVLGRDRRNHASPNAGYSEAAMAGALGIRLGGSAVYFGKPVEKPVIGDGKHLVDVGCIISANRMLQVTSLLCILTLYGLRLLLSHL